MIGVGRDADLSQVGVVPASGGEFIPVTDRHTANGTPTWSRDGRKLFFASNRTGKGQAELFRMNRDGTGLRQVTADPGRATEPAPSPDGNWFLFTSNRDGDNEVYLLPSKSVH